MDKAARPAIKIFFPAGEASQLMATAGFSLTTFMKLSLAAMAQNRITC
jgi:hypothetical protein